MYFYISLLNQSPAIGFAPELMNTENLVQVYTLSNLIGIYFCGAISILIFFILLLLVKNREKIYFHYSFFLLFILFYGIVHIQSLSAIVSLFPSSLFSKRLIEPTTIVSFGFYIFFSIELLNIQSQRNSLYKHLRAFGVGCFVYSILYFLLFPFLNSLEYWVFIGARAIIFPLSFYFIIDILKNINSPLKRYFLMGSSAYFIGSVVASLRYTLPNLPVDFLYKLAPYVYFEVGILIEILFFALALGHRIYGVHQEKEESSKALIQQLYINEKLAVQLNLKLEEEMKEQLLQLRAAKNQLQNQVKERLQAEHEISLAQSEILARKLHISPHFIFNCLNAIKYLIQSGQNEEASKYLIVFSKFIRMVLNASEEPLITLYQELSIIKNYLKLEQWRYDNEFSIVLTGMDNPGLHTFSIPPLLLQPFVENAIWHGLLNSRQKGKEIKIEVFSAQKQWHIRINDNGIGRKEARQYSLKRLYKRMGITLSKERIRLYNIKYQKNLKFTITDKESIEGKPLGTQVEFTVDY